MDGALSVDVRSVHTIGIMPTLDAEIVEFDQHSLASTGKVLPNAAFKDIS